MGAVTFTSLRAVILGTSVLALLLILTLGESSRAVALPPNTDPSVSNQDQDAVQALVGDGDLCPGVAEDPDGVADNDGCPDSDVGVSVVKEEQIVVQANVPSTHTMTITVMNGNYPADLRVTLLAVSHLGICEARLVPVAGDGYIEFVTDENNDSVVETRYSQIELGLIGMAAGEARVFARSYTLICTSSAPLVDPYEIQVDVLPYLPVHEESLGNPALCPVPWCVPPVPPGLQTPSDNVHKNFPDIVESVETGTCPTVPQWPVHAGDTDCDGFPDTINISPPNALASEAFVGTDAVSHCASTTGIGPGVRNDEPPPDRWPVDFDDNGIANGQDLLTFAPVFATVMGNPGYDQRWDINASYSINGQDLLKLAPFFAKTCA